MPNPSLPIVSDGGITLPVESADEVVDDDGAVDAGVLWRRLVEAFSAADIFAPGPLAAPVFAPGVVLAAVAEEEADEVDEEELEEEAEDELVEVVVEPDDDVLPLEELDVLLAVVLAKLRRRSDRLPRSRGEMRDAKFSAWVTPDKRRVASTGPEVTGAVRSVSTGSLGISLALWRQ